MMNEINKSFNEIIYERTTSPFFGTVIISWLIWNWRVLYLTFFISEDKISCNKIDFILENYSDFNHIVFYPLLSTLILITIIPFIANGSFWLSLRFNRWKIDQKNIVEKKQLLTIEQSIEIRDEISNQELKFVKLLNSKNQEIKQLNGVIEEYRTREFSNQRGFKSKVKISDDEVLSFVSNIRSDTTRLNDFQKIVEFNQGGYKIADRSDISSNTIAYLASNDIIESTGNGIYKFTDIGKEVLKIISN